MNKIVKIIIYAMISIKLAIIINATIRRIFFTKRNIIDISDTIYENGKNSYVIMNEVSKEFFSIFLLQLRLILTFTYFRRM